MEDLKRTRHWLRHTKYELCVACTPCSRECRRHVDTPCSDDDDCLHLIPVQDGLPGCNKTLEPMSDNPGFHPWFPSTKRRKKVIADRSFLMMIYLQSLSFFLSFFLFFLYLFMIDQYSFPFFGTDGEKSAQNIVVRNFPSCKTSPMFVQNGVDWNWMSYLHTHCLPPSVYIFPENFPQKCNNLYGCNLCQFDVESENVLEFTPSHQLLAAVANLFSWYLHGNIATCHVWKIKIYIRKMSIFCRLNLLPFVPWSQESAKGYQHQSKCKRCSCIRQTCRQNYTISVFGTQRRKAECLSEADLKKGRVSCSE